MITPEQLRRLADNLDSASVLKTRQALYDLADGVEEATQAVEIHTRYRGPQGLNGAKILARQDRKTTSVPYEHALPELARHRMAADKLAKRIHAELTGEWQRVVGGTYIFQAVRT